jgi:hypothetical protein
MVAIAQQLVKHHADSKQIGGDIEGYAKLSLKKYRPIAARNEDEKVFNGLR